MAVIIRIIILIIIGLIIAYVGILLLVLSLFNPVLFFITIGIEIRYIIWSIQHLKKVIRSIYIKLIKKWLEK